MTRVMRFSASLIVLAAGTGEAIAQRAVQAPSSETAGSAAAPPPPSGMESGLCGAMIVCGGELTSQLQAIVSTAGRTRGAISDDSDLDLYANYSDWLSLHTTINLERQRDDNLDSFYPSSNAFLRSEGLTARQLFVAVRPLSGLSVYGGKIHPNFASAYEQEPGMFYSFGTDYEQDERIGIGAEYQLPDTIGQKLRVSIESFFLDTSILSQSLLSRPSLDDPDPTVRNYRYSLSNFGPSNTGSLRSFTASLRGGEAERGLTYQLSITKEATDDPTGKTELGELIGASYDPTGDGIPLGERLGVTPFAEYAHFNNFQNNPDLTRHYLIGGLQFTYARWQLSLAGGLRYTDDPANAPGQAFTNAVATQERHAWDHQENATLTYNLPLAIAYSLTVGAGINHTVIAGKSSWAFGPTANFNIKF